MPEPSPLTQSQSMPLIPHSHSVSLSPSTTVYGGIIRFPEHPLSDMHGLLRCILRVRARHFSQVIEVLSLYGVIVRLLDLNRTWLPSLSQAEHTASLPHHGLPLVCPLPLSYLSASHYTLIPKSLTLRARGIAWTRPH